MGGESSAARPPVRRVLGLFLGWLGAEQLEVPFDGQCHPSLAGPVSGRGGGRDELPAVLQRQSQFEPSVTTDADRILFEFDQGFRRGPTVDDQVGVNDQRQAIGLLFQ